MGACDEDAMHFYPSDLMDYHYRTLEEFIETWRRVKHRKKKWDCCTYMIVKWMAETPPCVKKFDDDLDSRTKKHKALSVAGVIFTLVMGSCMACGRHEACGERRAVDWFVSIAASLKE